MKKLLLFLLFSTAVCAQDTLNYTAVQIDSILAFSDSLRNYGVSGAYEKVIGVTAGYETIADAITSAGTNKETWIVKDSVQHTTGDIPANVTLKFINNGKINFGDTVIIKSKIDAVDKEIFTGYVPKIYYNEINPIWFGADPTGTNNSSTAFQKALNTYTYLYDTPLDNDVYPQHVTLNVPYGSYRIDSTLIVKSGLTIKGTPKLAYKPSYLYLHNNYPSLVGMNGVDTIMSIRTHQNDPVALWGITINNQNTDTTGVGIVIQGRHNTKFEYVCFYNFAKDVSLFLDSQNVWVNITDCMFYMAKYGVKTRGRNIAVHIGNSRLVSYGATGYPGEGTIGVWGSINSMDNVIFDYFDTCLVVTGAGSIRYTAFDECDVGIVHTADSEYGMQIEHSGGGASYFYVERANIPYNPTVLEGNDIRTEYVLVEDGAADPVIKTIRANASDGTRTSIIQGVGADSLSYARAREYSNSFVGTFYADSSGIFGDALTAPIYNSTYIGNHINAGNENADTVSTAGVDGDTLVFAIYPETDGYSWNGMTQLEATIIGRHWSEGGNPHILKVQEFKWFIYNYPTTTFDTLATPVILAGMEYSISFDPLNDYTGYPNATPPIEFNEGDGNDVYYLYVINQSAHAIEVALMVKNARNVKKITWSRQ